MNNLKKICKFLNLVTTVFTALITIAFIIIWCVSFGYSNALYSIIGLILPNLILLIYLSFDEKLMDKCFLVDISLLLSTIFTTVVYFVFLIVSIPYIILIILLIVKLILDIKYFKHNRIESDLSLTKKVNVNEIIELSVMLIGYVALFIASFIDNKVASLYYIFYLFQTIMMFLLFRNSNRVLHLIVRFLCYSSIVFIAPYYLSLNTFPYYGYIIIAGVLVLLFFYRFISIKRSTNK